MQTTLLGLGIALILALVTALVAPLFVDWNHYRGAFEAEAGRLTGLDVRINGPIDARLLPTPIVTLRNVEAAAPGEQPQMRAGTLTVELALGALLRGQLRASNLHLVGAQLDLALDRSGAVRWPAAAMRRPSLSLSHLDVEDGHVVLTDASSGSRLVLRKLRFNGDISTFTDSFSGEGAALVGSEPYAYRISGSLAGDDAIKLRLGVDPANHPLTTRFDGTLTLSRGVPQFQGTLELARPAGATLANGQRVVNTPWRAAAEVRATPAAAAFSRIALRYGPEDRALLFTGSGELGFGAHPHLQAHVASLQLDIDHAIANPDLTGEPPLLLLRRFLETSAASAKLPVPARIAVAIDALTVGGATIESLSGNFQFDGSAWSVDQLQFHAPGMSDMTISGKLTGTARSFAFTGPASLQTGELGALVAWLDGRNTRGGGTIEARTLSGRGMLTIASERMAVEQITARIDQAQVQGRLAYDWPQRGRPARLDAELRAGELDLDALAGFAKAAVGAGTLALPRSGTLALDVGHATLAGVRARTVSAHITFGPGTLQIDRLAVDDLGGAAFAVSGRIDQLSSHPRGQLTFDVDARALDGLNDFLAKFAPQLAAPLRRVSDRLAPAKVHAVLAVASSDSAPSTAELHLTGGFATAQLRLDAKASGTLLHPGNAMMQLTSRIEADDGTTLAALLGLDRVLAVDQLPGELTLTAAGPIDGNIQLKSKLALSGFDAAVGGLVRLGGSQPVHGTLQVEARAADLRPLRRQLTGEPGAAIPVSAHAALAIDGGDLTFSDISAKIGTSTWQGHLAVATGETPLRLDGEIGADRVDAADAAALLLGLPRADSADAWSSAAIGAGAFDAINGAVTFRFGEAAFTPALAARDVMAVVHLARGTIAIDDIDGKFDGGRLSGALAFRRDPNGLAVHAQLGVEAASAATLLDPALNVSGGAATATLTCDGFGANPLSLIGSLHGGVTVKLTQAQFGGLDLGAFDAAMAAAGRNGAIDMAKVRSAVNAALILGRLSIPQSQAALTLTAGMLNLNNVTLDTQGGGTLALAGSVDLAKAAIDARMTLSEPPPAKALIRIRPQLAFAIKGPLAAPTRTLDISALASWLALSAAELQTRRLELLEADRRMGATGLAPHVSEPPPVVTPPGTAVETPPPSLTHGPFSTGAALERLQPPPAPSPAQTPPAQTPPAQNRPAGGALDSGGPAHAAPRGAALPGAIRPAAPRTPPSGTVPANAAAAPRL